MSRMDHALTEVRWLHEELKREVERGRWIERDRSADPNVTAGNLLGYLQVVAIKVGLIRLTLEGAPPRTGPNPYGPNELELDDASADEVLPERIMEYAKYERSIDGAEDGRPNDVGISRG